MKTTMKFLFTSAKASCLGWLLSLCTAIPAFGAPSSDGSGEIAIYTEATGSDVISTADFTHDFDTNDREDSGSFTRSGAEITLNRDGHYLAIYNSRFNGAPQAGSEERVEVQSCLNLAGSKLPIGWSQGFIRRQQGHLDAITTGMAVIEATANDVLQLQSFRTDDTTVGSVRRFPDATAIQLVKLDDVNMSYARLSLAANQTGPTINGTAVKVVYDSTDELDAGFSYAGGDLTLADAGKYLVIANTYLAAVNNRVGFVQELTLDGVAISGTRTNIYLRGSQSTEEGAAAIGTIIETTAPNQILSVLGELDGADVTSNYLAGRCGLTVVKLPSTAAGTAVVDPDFIRLSHNANQDINTTADIIFDTQIEVAPEFVHSVNSSAITVATGGDYLFLGSFYGADDGAARGLSNPGWAINGTRLNRGQSGRYTRNVGPPEFGNTLGLVASGLAASDQIKMVTRALGASGTNNANPMALQGVRLASLFTAPAAFEVTVIPTAIATTEGGATGIYELALGLAPAGVVTVTVSPDVQSEVSVNGTNFFPTLEIVFSDATAQTITVRATDDALIESAHSSTITHAISATTDPFNYPTTQPVPSVTNSITDNDVVPVNAVADSSTSNVSEDETANQSVLAPQSDLLANDSDGINNVVSAFDSTSAFGAAVNVLADGTFSYDPTTAPGAQSLAAGATGVDTFDYTAMDLDGNTDTATVSITVDGANDAPEAISDTLFDGPLENASSYVSTLDLTANDGSFRTVSTDFTFPPGSDLRLLPGKTVTQSPSVGNPPGNGFAERAFDGNVTTFTHTDSNDNSFNHTWQVDFGQDASLENVTLFNRTDCCGARLRDITVTVLDNLGGTVFTSAPLNPENAEGFTTGGSLFVDFGGPITGRTLVVTRMVDTYTVGVAVSESSILSLGEVTIIGSVPGTYTETNDFLLLNYDASQTADAGRWENLGTSGGTNADWLLTDITLDSTPGSARAQISAAYVWDNATDLAVLPAAGSIQNNLSGSEDTEDATWEFWAKPANNTDVMTLFETGGGSGFGVIINAGVLEAATELDGGAMNGSYVSYDLVADPLGLVGNDPTTEFNQYVAAIDIGGGGIALYVNGVKVDETISGTSGDWDGGDAAGLGRFQGTNHGGFTNSAAGTIYNAPFLGSMAAVRLYSGTLTGAQVLQNFLAVANDTDIDGDSITATGVIDGTGTFVANGSQATLASGALVTMTNATGGFAYNPNGAFSLDPGATGTDTFTYRVTDGNGATAEADVTVTITGVIDALDDVLLAKEGEMKVFFANALVGNDEDLPTASNAYIDLTPENISGVNWTNTGSSGFNGTGVGSVSAPDLESNFGALGAAVTGANQATLDPISAGDATIEIWFKPIPGQTGKKTIFETGGNGNGFSIVFDPATNEVTASVDGGDDITANIQATATGVVTSEFNQFIVAIEPNGGAEVGVATGVFEDLLTVYLNNTPALPFNSTPADTGINSAGLANDWAGTDGGAINRVSGTSALNENFPGMEGEVAILRAYSRILTPAEMELNYDAAVQEITSVSSPTTGQGASVTLNADRSVTVDYSGVSLAPGATLMDSFTYTIEGGAGGTAMATANIIISGNSLQEAWRLLYYGDIVNSGPGADSATGANGLTNLQNFALDLDPTAPAGTLDVDQDSDTILTLGPPMVWIDPASGRIYLRHTRRTDFATVPLTITDQFSRDLVTFEDSSVAPAVIATGTGDSGAAIEAVQTEFPLILPVSGGKGRFGRIDVTAP